MRYICVKWKHERDDEPVLLYSELGPDSFEERKVEVFRDGRMGFAGNSKEVGSTALGEKPVPSLDEIGRDPQFEATQISRDEFEAIWSRAISQTS